MAMLEHGGRLRVAAQIYGIPLESWIDLSTGISPWSCPIPHVPESAWHRLPEPDDGLDAVAAHYYGNSRLLATAGSQPIIQQLPTMWAPSRVAIIGPTYNEHLAAWRHKQHGHDVQVVDSLAKAMASQASIIVLCNPNNPTAAHHQPTELMTAAKHLAAQSGWLIVDEAYGDAYPECSITPLAGSEQAPRLLTLRSLGKFFGLAGARVGFVFGDPVLLERLAESVGPWTLSGPSRYVAHQALANCAWQANQITRIKDAGVRLKLLLEETIAPKEPVKSTGLFSTLRLADAESLFTHMALNGILVRLFRDESLIRIGIAADHEWKRLELTLRSWQ